MGKDLIKDAGVARLRSSVHRVPEILTGQATLLAVIRKMAECAGKEVGANLVSPSWVVSKPVYHTYAVRTCVANSLDGVNG